MPRRSPRRSTALLSACPSALTKLSLKVLNPVGLAHDIGPRDQGQYLRPEPRRLAAQEGRRVGDLRHPFRFGPFIFQQDLPVVEFVGERQGRQRAGFGGEGCGQLVVRPIAEPGDPGFGQEIRRVEALGPRRADPALSGADRSRIRARPASWRCSSAFDRRIEAGNNGVNRYPSHGRKFRGRRIGCP